MEIAKLIVDLIGKLIWPIVVTTIILIFRKHIIKRFQDIKKFKGAGIEVTFEKIKAIVEETLENESEQPDTPKELKKIIYQTDVTDENVIKADKKDLGNSTLLAFATNQSYTENLNYRIYYDPAYRNHNSPFKYIGLYKDQEISAIGKLIKIVYCDLENGKLVATNGDDLSHLSSDEYDRIKETISITKYYDLNKGCKFFLVDNFYKTHYKKSSAYPIRAKKYVWLDEIDGFEVGMTANQLAKLLNRKEWE